MIPPALALYFERCRSGDATTQDYTDAMSAVDAAFANNQDAASRKARALRSGGYVPRRERLNAMRARVPYRDRLMAAAGDV